MSDYYGYGGGYGQRLIEASRNRATSKKKKKRPPRKPGLTLEQWATQQVEKLLGAQIKGIESQRGIYLDELRKESELEMQRGQALAQALQQMNMPANIQTIFGNAGHDIAGLAQGFSGQTKNIANAQAAEVTNMLSGTGTEGAVRNQGENMGNVVYGVGGYGPARSLAEQGASYAADAALQPAFAQRQGAMEAARVHSEGLSGLSDFTNALVELRAGKPQMIMDLIAERQGLLQDEEDRRSDERNDQRDWYLKLAALEMSRGNSDRANQYLNLANQREGRYQSKDKGLDVSGNLLPGFHSGPGGRVIKDGWHWDPKKGRVIKDKSSSSSGGVDWGDVQSDIAADLLVEGRFTEEVPNPDPYSSDSTLDKKISWERAYQILWAKYSGKVKNKKRLRGIITKILRANGFTKAGAPAAEVGASAGIIPGEGR